MQWRYARQDPRFPGVSDRVRNLLVRHRFHHLLEADRCSDGDLIRLGRDTRGGPIGPATLREIRAAAQAFRADLLMPDWSVC